MTPNETRLLTAIARALVVVLQKGPYDPRSNRTKAIEDLSTAIMMVEPEPPKAGKP